MKIDKESLERWEKQAPPDLPGTAARSPTPSPVKPTAARFTFLTANGQSATPLEQESLLGENDLVEASFLDRCQLVTRCIGRVRFQTPRGRQYATGFMIAPSLMITNHHVFPEAAVAEGASIEFDYRYDIAGQVGVTEEFDLDPAQFFVSDEALDFAVVAVSPASTVGASLAARSYLRLHAASGKVVAGDFVTIIQYPDGLPMRVALRENEITRAQPDEDVLWYRADTAHGSSGAPVFNDTFQVAAVHGLGRIKRNERDEYALARGGWTASLEGLSESDVIWEANVGVRVSRICEVLLRKAEAKSPAHRRVLEQAMAGGDVLAVAIAKAKARAGRPAADNEESAMSDTREPASGSAGGSSIPVGGAGLVIPLQLRISLEAGRPVAGGPELVLRTGSAAPDTGLEAEAFRMQIPVIYDGLDRRAGFDRGFLGLGAGRDAPMPRLTSAGEAVAASLLDGSGLELKYHKFSIWMQKERRLALFTASNVDWRGRKRTVDGRKVDRDTLAGFPPNARLAEQWVNDPRIAAQHQLPDVFYTEDRSAFDKGHLVRRDDVCWGTTFEDIQMANGDTYHVTNCSPQTQRFNRGDERWGELESHVQTATRRDLEKAVAYAGPMFRENDRWFRGRDDAGPVRIQIPRRYWKIVVVAGNAGPEAYGFVLEQDVRAITEKEFYVTEEWIGSMKRIRDIESQLRGWISLAELKSIDQYDEVR